MVMGLTALYSGVSSALEPMIRESVILLNGPRENPSNTNMYSMKKTPTRHPNTADIDVVCVNGYKLSVRGESIGGGKIKIVRINQIDVEFTGEYSTLIVRQTDKPGVVAHITQCLSNQQVNIAFMRLFREEKGAKAYTVVESDEQIPDSILEEMKKNEHVHELMLIQI